MPLKSLYSITAHLQLAAKDNGRHPPALVDELSKIKPLPPGGFFFGAASPS
jgi:hypothetical protein